MTLCPHTVLGPDRPKRAHIRDGSVFVTPVAVATKFSQRNEQMTYFIGTASDVLTITSATAQKPLHRDINLRISGRTENRVELLQQNFNSFSSRTIFERN